jgi:hypothetical protein
MRRRHPNSRLVAFIKRWRVPFAAVSVGLYAVALVTVVFVFPDVSNLWVSVFVLVSGFTAGLATLADLLVSAEEAVRDDGGDPR